MAVPVASAEYKERGENEWYFLSPRTRKYAGGSRPSRRTADNRGRWKPSTGQKPKPGQSEPGTTERLCKGGAIRFCENTLAYHLGPAKNETKTKWLMHELTVPEYEIKISDETRGKTSNSMLLDRYVSCRIYKSPLTKWNEDEDEETSFASEGAAPSSQPGPVMESGQGTAAPTPSNRQAGKRPAEERRRGYAIAPNKRASQPTLAPEAPAPMLGAGGGGGMRVPIGVGAAGYHGVPGQPAHPMPWPRVMHNHLQGPAQRPPMLTYKYNGRTVVVPYSGQAPVQGPPGLRLFPPHRATATTPNSLGQTMLMRPPNIAAGQPVPRPPAPRPPPQQRQHKEEMDDMNKHRVLAQVLAELKALEAQGSASGAAQQQRAKAPMQPQRPCFDAGVDHPARAKAAVVPHPQFCAPHNCYPFKGGQQQCSAAIPSTSVPGGAAAPVEAKPASDNAPSKLSVPGNANEGSGKGDRNNNGGQLFSDLAAMNRGDPGWDLKNVSLSPSL
ncbi:NAC domain-containing protein 58-like isoform X3 [Phragmites australis]|uniref:NAC domain-containing protein 58-like isoform X3 n=1 Tax=Phragmites australis TaxID=29695 RepID=UPI002D78E4AB|nr:NAC domain-containing protein 58-like isoform X3 [Phragmites australis]